MQSIPRLLALMVGYIAYQFYFKPGFNQESIRGKNVVITGASTGIGEQLAYEYSKLGAKVLITARREHVLQKVVNRCMELGAEEAYYIPLDMSILGDAKRLIDEAKMTLGGIDHLVLNHITSNYMKVWNGDFERLQNVMDVNFRSYVALATHATPMLNETRGSMTVLISLAGKIGVPFASVYCASKSALDGYFSSLRHEFALRNVDIAVTLCTLGIIKTENVEEFSKDILRPNMFEATCGSASDAAYRIMTGTAQRERDIYYPWLQTYPAILARYFVPQAIDRSMKHMYLDGAVEKATSLD